jgi:hypothetical protein
VLRRFNAYCATLASMQQPDKTEELKLLQRVDSWQQVSQ